MKVNYFYAIAALGMMASCSNPDYFNTEEGSEYREYNVQKVKAEYEKNFLAAYGAVDPNETWDHSSYAKQTRGIAEGTEIIDVWNNYPVQEKDIDETVKPWSDYFTDMSLCSSFVEKQGYPQLGNDGKNNSAWGSLDYTLIANGDLAISPVWHHNCMIDYLFVVEGYNPSTNYITRYVFTQKDIDDVNNYQPKKDEYTYDQAFNHDGVMQTGVWKVPFEQGTVVRMYLAKKGAGERELATENGYAIKGSTINAYHSIDGEYQKGINLYRENLIHENKNPYFSEVYLLDDPMHRDYNANGKYTDKEGKKYDLVSGQDHDYNDLAVLVGNFSKTPTTDDKTITIVRTVTKRYMCEDLGANQSSDIDFNDLVVDMAEAQYIIDLESNIDKYEIVNSIKTTANNVERPVVASTMSQVSLTAEGEWPKIYAQHQNAIIRAMGGTLNFEFYVGNKKVYEKDGHSAYAYTQMLNTQNGYDAAKVIENINLDEFGKPWIMNENNLKLVVTRDNKSNDGVQELGPNKTKEQWEIRFPKTGEVPYMIALDPYWKTEIMPYGTEILDPWKPMKWNDERSSVLTDVNSPMYLLQKEVYGEQQ
ncbi:MAG: hypothetical protein HUJ98_07050 [Bacteroidaceae bacterium]|nr:hypothetical protein [Bacteroidaceae bacterium]